MKTNQPQWQMIANLGDVNPIEYGGFFVYRDRTGQYTEEAEILDPIEDDGGITGDHQGITWEIRRFTLERCTYLAPEADGGEPAGGYPPVLSDNKFHPFKPAWFAGTEAERASRPQDTTYLSNVARSMDYTEPDLIADLCSEDPIRRACAYRAIGEYHGWDNFDSYPRTYNKRSELPRRILRPSSKNR